VIAGQSLNEKIVYVQTGNSDLDNGEYVLFALVADKKLAPHTETGPYDTNRTREAYRVWRVDVIDENEPLIVFDTVVTTDGTYIPESHPGSDENEPKGTAYNTGDSPEDNTFPKLTGGEYFTVNGYTLRANKQGTENEVVRFRMAWIPFGIGPGETPADNYIGQVQRALSALNYPASFNSLPSTIQHWEFEPVENAANPNVYDKGKLLKGSDQILDKQADNPDIYRKQVFKKTFNLLGGQDDLNPSYYNFRPGGENGELENETKLFVFYAEDNMGHVVYRQLRLLGNKTPPTLAVYDITGMDDIKFTDNEYPRNLPNLNNDDPTAGPEYYFFNEDGNITNEARHEYEASLALYQPFGYQSIVNVEAHKRIDPERDRTEPYTAYPRDTIVKYWVTAARSGDLFVENISMRDITYSTNDIAVGYYNGTDALSYVEMLPEVTQRVFLFEAKDTLGNNAQLQRTVAVTNAAVLNNITTATQNGDYGIGQTITLQANFSNLIKWTGPNPPLLNVRHNQGGTSSWNGSPVVSQIATKTPANTPALFLEFDLVIEEGFTGVLETMYFGMDITAGDDTTRNNRPITLPTGTRILDNSRGDDAFTPRNSSGFDWTANGQGSNKSLQGSKTITLDGIRPEITGFTLNPPSGKTLYTDNPNQGYYFKADETIEFTLTADKPIFTSANPEIGLPTIGLNIGGVWRSATWQRASGTNGMVFSFLVNSTNTPLVGTVSAIRLDHVNTIVDNVENAFLGGSEPLPIPAGLLNSLAAIHIDRQPPGAAGTTLNWVATGSITNPNYSANPTLAIGNTSGENAPVAKTQYSLNNGVTWVDFPKPTDGYTDDDPATNAAIVALGWTAPDTPTTLKIKPGEWTLVTRYIDRAGNEGAPTTLPLHVNDAFPKLIAVTPVQSNGWYGPTGTIQNLQFDLNFEDQVHIEPAGSQINITLRNRSADNNSDTSGVAVATTTSTTTQGPSTIRVSFNVSGKEMKDGLYVSAVDFTNLRDKFGNQGGTYGTATGNWPTSGSTAPNITPNTSSCPNLGAGLRVDTIAPTVNLSTSTPVNTTGVADTFVNSGAGDYRNKITLTFNETVIKGSGTITIKPQKDFYIPPVFENNGYYLDYETEARSNTSTTGRSIWVAGFYDIYNALPNTDEGHNHRNALTESTTSGSQSLTPTASVIPSDVLDTGNPDMSRLRLNKRTGQPAGPYVRTTHGLVTGYGYKGEYTGGADAEPTGDNNVNFYRRGPDTIAGGDDAVSALVPDTSTKWVLAYPYSISNADNVNLADSDLLHTPNSNRANVVPNIRAALEAAKFRWQEIDVAYSNVVVAGNTVTITLDEPLLKGLRWELSYPAGTFTDDAGNEATAIGVDGYTFWSPGTQKPVVRVDRKSFDARTSEWQKPTSGGTTQGYDYNNPAANSGWSIDEFNSIGYRIETETPDAYISYGTTTRRNSITSNTGTSFDAVTANWTGQVTNSTYTINWDAQDNNDSDRSRRFWVRPNLLRLSGRSGNADDFTGGRCFYYINGVLRRSSGYLRMYRSYNRDAQTGDFVGTTATNSDRRRASISFDPMEAGKSYVFATAQRTGQTASAMGYEGVFRTVIVLNNIKKTTRQGTIANTTVNDSVGKVVVEGSNILSATPSIPGFPVRDGAESGDSRFVKMMYNVRPRATTPHANNDGYNDRYYWVSTEIVSEWYFRYYGNGGGSQRTGDVNNYLTVSYGDLTYGNNVDHRDSANND
jgi:hypothetical protein